MRRRPTHHQWVSDLARYNGERARGIVHTPEWQQRMSRLQDMFDEQQRLEFGPQPSRPVRP